MTRKQHLAARQRQEEERVATRVAEKSAKPVEKKPAVYRARTVSERPKNDRAWRLTGKMTVRLATEMLTWCELPVDNADALADDFYDSSADGVVFFESDVRAWAEGRS